MWVVRLEQGWMLCLNIKKKWKKEMANWWEHDIWREKGGGAEEEEEYLMGVDGGTRGYNAVTDLQWILDSKWHFRTISKWRHTRSPSRRAPSRALVVTRGNHHHPPTLSFDPRARLRSDGSAWALTACHLVTTAAQTLACNSGDEQRSESRGRSISNQVM